MAWIARTMAWIVGALLIGAIVSFIWGRLRPPTGGQSQALALLAPESLAGGVPNAWANLWLLDYDIPAAQINEVYALERQHLEAWAQRERVDETFRTSYVDRAARYFPKRASLSIAEAEQLCRPADNDCLAKVRANLPSLRELLSRHSGRLAQVRAMAPDAVLWDDMPATPETPMPSLAEPGNLRLTAAAVDFVDGRQQPGLAQACRDARTIRHLHAHTNSLVGAMVADSWMDATERLLADMLSELPATQPIPADCVAAFAPVTRADVNLCAPMQREYQAVLSSIASVDPAQLRGMRRLRFLLLVDGGQTHALLAPTYAWACQAQTIDDLQNDRPLSSRQMPVVCPDLFDQVSNPLGQVLAQVAVPDYAKYLNRNEDFAAGLRATGWLLATRATAASPGEWQRELAAAGPVLQRGGSRLFQLDVTGYRLVMRYGVPRQHRTALILPLAQQP